MVNIAIENVRLTRGDIYYAGIHAQWSQAIGLLEELVTSSEQRTEKLQRNEYKVMNDKVMDDTNKKPCILFSKFINLNKSSKCIPVINIKCMTYRVPQK